MNVQIIADSPTAFVTIASRLEPDICASRSIVTAGSVSLHCEVVIVATDLRSVQSIENLRSIENTLRRAQKRIFLMRRRSRVLAAQAYALGATKIVFTLEELASELTLRATIDKFGPHTTEGAAAAGAVGLRNMFSSLTKGDPIDLAVALQAGAAITSKISENGLSNWLDVVRRHHEGTYQHCLLVTGVVVDFAFHLGLHSRDVEGLCFAAMLHDIGKAAIPTEILDKPGRLDPRERGIVETHPVVGFDSLRRHDEIGPEMLDCVRHHHEFLDGSGYPDGLIAGRISDLVRILTIADIYSALIERRSYKEPIPRVQAFEILAGMRGKLEELLVAAFKPVALYR